MISSSGPKEPFFVGGVNPVEEMKSAGNSPIPEIVFRALRYTCYGDTIGQGVEMWTRKLILDRWDDLKRGLVYERRPPYDVGIQKGWYTDDTEMSIGVIRAILKERFPTPLDFATSFFEVYDSFKAENNGTPRGGYGQFGRIAALEVKDRFAALQKMQKEGKFREDGPGNGSGMRLLPVLLLSENKQDIFPRLISQTLSTHNHVCAILSNLIYLDVADALIHKNLPYEIIFDYVLDFFSTDRKFTHLFPTLEICNRDYLEYSKKVDIPVHGDFKNTVDAFYKRLKVLNSLDGPLDEKGTNMDCMVESIMKPQSVQADETLFGTLYCWRWTNLDLEKSHHSHLSLIMRCLSFGGDVDTLLAHVIPVTFLQLENKGEMIDLPDWVYEECKEARLLLNRIDLT